MSNILEVLVIVNITITQTDQQTSTLHEKRKSASQKKTMKMTKNYVYITTACGSHDNIFSIYLCKSLFQ